jgi:plasmid stabilization system protein ParE
MEWAVSLTRRAEKDLAGIVRYIARDNPTAAEAMGRALLSRLESLRRQPAIGIAVKNRKNIRALLHRKYYIVYHYDESAAQLQVLRFWHSARDLGLLRLREPGDLP